MLATCPPTGMEVIPGKSTMVRFGHDLEKILRMMGLSTIYLFLPQTWSVTWSMPARTSLKLLNLFFTPFSKISSNSA